MTCMNLNRLSIPVFVSQIPRGNAAKCHVVVSVTQQYETNPALGSSMRSGYVGE